MRQEIPIVVLGSDGRPAAGASVYVRTDPGGADATIYQAKTGTATHGNPRTSDAQGRVEGWLERNDYAATITVSGLPPWVEYFPIAPAADGGIDALWLPDDVIAARHIAPNAVGSSEIADSAVGLAELAAGIQFSAYRSVAQAGSQNSVLLCDAEEYDDGGYYNPATGRWTPTPGFPILCHLSGAIIFQANVAPNYVNVAVYKNGAVYKYLGQPHNVNTGSGLGLGGGCDVKLNGTTDYVDLRWASDATNSAPAPTSAHAWFQGHVLRRA